MPKRGPEAAPYNAHDISNATEYNTKYTSEKVWNISNVVVQIACWLIHWKLIVRPCKWRNLLLPSVGKCCSMLYGW